MKKLDMHSPDLVAKNIDALAALFPNCLTEATDENGQPVRRVDFDLLRQELEGSLVEGPTERFRLDWPGKRQALLTANAPIAKTLRPDREASVNFDSTRNMYIEGDNLDALKLLQENYLAKVKMIYIDPPYNTGHDFIYEDDFAEDSGEYFLRSNQKDEEGFRLTANTEANGRFHSDWLSMMYSRLKLARNLLRDDGVIFISVDDNEIHHLRKLCDERFGQDNFEGHIHWRRRHNQPNDKTKMIGLVAEHIIAYSKNKTILKSMGVGKIDLTGSFSNPDNDPRGKWASKAWKVGSDQSGSRYKITTPTGIILDEEWMGEEATYEKLVTDNRIFFSRNGDGLPRKKYFLSEREEEGQCATNWWEHQQFGHNQGANDCLTELMGTKNVFSNPKPVELLRGLMQISNSQDTDIILDFFSGSATTAHAVMQLNAEDGGQRRFILVQLPESLDPNIKEQKAGADFCDSIGTPRSIAEIGKERIRRAGQKITEGQCHENWNRDTGFRAFKIDSSNMLDVYYTPDETAQDKLAELVDNIKPGRTDEDLLFQVMLDWGLDLALPLEQKNIADSTVFAVDGNALAACFADNVGEELVTELAARIPPFLRVLFRDSSFASDSDRINVEQIFKQLSPSTEVKVI